MKIATVAALLLIPAAAGAQAPAVAGGFCARMASQFGMKQVKAAGGKPAYEARALQGLGVALFGGSTMVSMALKPPTSGPTGDLARFGDACALAANRIACAVTGPAVFEMAVGSQVAPTEVRDGETAEVSMAKNRIRCEKR